MRRAFASLLAVALLAEPVLAAAPCPPSAVTAVTWVRTPADAARRTIENLRTGSLRFRRDVSDCEPARDRASFLACMGDALDEYADWLEGVAKGPESTAALAAPAVRRAGARVRAADSIAGARRAVAEASAVVRKTIDLVRAGGDGEVRRLEIAQRGVVVESLGIADAALVRAIGL